MPLERMALGLETEHQIYVGSSADAATDAERNTVNSKATKALIKTVTSSSDVMGPVWTLLRSHSPVTHGVQWLRNGARFYEDVHGTPEYSTPECVTPDDLVAADIAGMEILAAAAPMAGEKVGMKVMLYRNNSDGHGHSRGCHENYSISPPLFEHITSGAASGAAPRILSTWLLVRQLLTGAGKVGVERFADPTPFQLSQRPDFIRTFRSGDTISNRPIIEVRNEAHPDGTGMRRLHVICGDTNMCPWATYLKTGLTGLLLMAMDDGWLYGRTLPVFTGQGVHWFRTISRDPDCRFNYVMTMVKGDAEGTVRRMRVPDILRMYLDAIADYAARRLFPTERERNAWRAVPEKAAYCAERIADGRWHELEGRLDWVTKRLILEDWLARAGRGWTTLHDPANPDPEKAAPWRRKARIKADLAYPFLDAGRGKFFRMRGEGRIVPIVKAGDAIRAISEAPLQSRAWQRTALVERFGRWLAPGGYPHPVAGVDWEKVVFMDGGKHLSFTLTRPWEAHPELFRELLALADTPTELAALMNEQPVPGTMVEISVPQKKEGA